MGLDIYAGKLTRYYSRNWKTIVQQLAEENGQKCCKFKKLSLSGQIVLQRT